MPLIYRGSSYSSQTTPQTTDLKNPIPDAAIVLCYRGRPYLKAQYCIKTK